MVIGMPTVKVAELPHLGNEPVDERAGGTGKFIRDVFFSNLPLPFQKLRTYLWLIVFARALGPSGFGIWSLFLTTLGMALVVTSMNQGGAMMRFLGGDRNRQETNRVFSSVSAAVLVSSAIVAGGLTVFSRDLSNELFRDPRGRTILLLLAAVMPLETLFEMMRGLLRGRRLNRSWAFFTLGRQVPECLLLIAVALWWMRDPVALVGTYLFTAALAVSIGFIYLYRYQHTRLVKPSRATLSKYLPYGLALVPGGLVSLLSFSADRYLVAHYLDLRQVGIYSVCFTVSALGFFFVGPLNDVLLPEMAALYDAGSWNQFYARFSGVQKFVFGLAVAATAILFAFPQQILRLFTTQEFSSGGPVLAILGLQGVFMSIIMLYIIMLYVRLHVWWTTWIWAGMGVIVLAMDVILLPRVGIIGAGWGQLISSVAGAVVIIGLNWEIFRRTFRLAWLVQAGIPFAGVWLLAHFWQSGTLSIGQSLVRIAFGTVIFVLGLAMTRYLRASELIALHRAVSRSAA